MISESCCESNNDDRQGQKSWCPVFTGIPHIPKGDATGGQPLQEGHNCLLICNPIQLASSTEKNDQKSWFVAGAKVRNCLLLYGGSVFRKRVKRLYNTKSCMSRIGAT